VTGLLQYCSTQNAGPGRRFFGTKVFVYLGLNSRPTSLSAHGGAPFFDRTMDGESKNPLFPFLICRRAVSFGYSLWPAKNSEPAAAVE
jgi:hypothetical protein